MTTATPNAPYLSYRRIEFEAQRLLCQYSREHAPITEPPIPIEEILERHLNLYLAICDLREVVGFDDVLGALCVDRREVMVDQSLDPDEFPELESRFRFTLAHEIGHWQLHRNIYEQHRDSDEPPFVSRVSEANRRIERQADYFAASVLMPRPFVFQLWRHLLEGRIITITRLEADRQAILEDEIVRRRIVPETPEDEDNMMLDWAAVPLAEEFRVSPMAMRIRLEELKLIVR
jgi:Zn-dependent peptidase ImmA (M78 family)